MKRKTVILGAASKIDTLIKHLEYKYEAENFEVQVLDIHDEDLTGKLFQMKEKAEKTWVTTVKDVTGLATAATAKLMIQGQDLEVEVFGGKWLDKVAVGAISMVILWPLLITAGIGAWKQHALLDELYREVTLYMAETAPPHPLQLTHCTNCGNAISAEMRFCGNCGMKLA
jgi:hypothetical protein